MSKRKHGNIKSTYLLDLDSFELSGKKKITPLSWFSKNQEISPKQNVGVRMIQSFTASWTVSWAKMSVVIDRDLRNLGVPHSFKKQIHPPKRIFPVPKHLPYWCVKFHHYIKVNERVSLHCKETKGPTYSSIPGRDQYLAQRLIHKYLLNEHSSWYFYAKKSFLKLFFIKKIFSSKYTN